MSAPQQPADVLEVVHLQYGRRIEWRRKPAPPAGPGVVPQADQGEAFLVCGIGSTRGEVACRLTHAEAKAFEEEAHR